MRRYGFGPVFVVRYYSTDIVEIFSNGLYRISTDRWSTVTTIQRINWFSPVSLYRENGVVYVAGIDRNRESGPARWNGIPLDDRFPFYDGMIVDSAGRPTEPPPESAVESMIEAHESRRDRRREYFRGYQRMRRAQLRWDQYCAGQRSTVPLRDIIRLRNVTDRADFQREFGAEAVAAALPVIASSPMEYRWIGPPDTGKEHGYQLLIINVGEDDDPQPNPYLKMLNPSTGEYCIEAVGPQCASVDDALMFRNGTTELPMTLT